MPEVAERSTVDDRGYEWDYFPGEDGEPFRNRDGHLVLGWHPRTEDQDAKQLCAAFEAYEGHPLVLRPIFCRWASEVECKVNGWEEGSFTVCRRPSRAKHPFSMWQIELAEQEATDA